MNEFKTGDHVIFKPTKNISGYQHVHHGTVYKVKGYERNEISPEKSIIQILEHDGQLAFWGIWWFDKVQIDTKLARIIFGLD